MCGIVVHVSRPEALDSPSFLALSAANALRGPDSQDTITTIVKSSSATEQFKLSLMSSVLHLRGDHVFKQPHTNAAGDILCWNGEIFQGLDISIDENDGVKLFAALTAPFANILEILSSIEGPYAFVFYRASDSSLFFGRDPLGRRSLLIRQSWGPSWAIELSSVSLGFSSTDSANFDEVPAHSVYQLLLSDIAASQHSTIPSTGVSEDTPDLKGIVAHPRKATDRYTATLSLNREMPQDLSAVSAEYINTVVEEFSKRLEESVALRVTNIPPRPNPTNARLAVLFSGGIDCAVVAYLADKYIPPDEPIDLLNVAFENPRSIKANQKAKVPVDRNGTYDVPDRQTGMEQLEELRRVCPLRRWNFVKVDVTFEESTKMRSTIENLMYPSRTVMDLSLGMALYFASRGQGTVRNDSTGTDEEYISPARVLLSGLGSDELLGGYSRHRVAFRNNGWKGLTDELQLDLDRLPSRNLGRDDRVISSNAKETRYPYLNLSLVAYLAALPVYAKLDPRLGEGVGDKRLLRLAAERMGLVKAAGRRKRAMQFGSRSAKMTGSADEKRGDYLI